MKRSKLNPGKIALLRVRQGMNGTEIIPFEATGELFEDGEIKKALTSGTEDGLFASLILRGLLDE
jgi:hypothetical protein